MRTIILILIVSISTFTKAQTNIVLDTIYANDTKNVALFFPEPIRQGITGASNFVFTYNREKEQYFGLLQAKPGKESNLLVINKDGSVFSYILKYKERISKLNYFIPIYSNIGNEKPIETDSVLVKTSEKDIGISTYYYQKYCAYLLDGKQRIGRIMKQNEDIVLSVENIVFDREELYFVIQLENNSTLDYDLSFLNLSIETRQKGKKKSLQTLYQKPIYIHKLPSKIAKGKMMRFVYVMPKFSLSKDHRVILELDEKDGERNLKLNISRRYINNPN